MIVSLDPIAFTTAAFSIPMSAGQAELQALRNLCEIRVQNHSPLPLQITIGDEKHWLAAFMQDVFPLQDAATQIVNVVPGSVAVASLAGTTLPTTSPVILVPTPTTGASSGVQPAGTYALLLDVSDTGSRITGTYPSPVAAVPFTPHSVVLPTYSSCSDLFAPYANANDIWQISADPNHVIQLSRLEIDGVQTNAGLIGIKLIVRNTVALPGGGNTADAITKHDSTDAAAAATVMHFTADPALGGLASLFRRYGLFISAQATASAPDALRRDAFKLIDPAKPLQLSQTPGTNAGLSINLIGTTAAGLNLIVNAEWTEIPKALTQIAPLMR